MSCLFCKSFYHLSQNCNVYASDQSRKRIFRNKKFFDQALNLLSFGKFSRKMCKLVRKCYICFSKEHYTFLCSHKDTEMNMFIPNIDQDLIPRFLQTFYPLEKFMLACISPLTFDDTCMKVLRVFSQHFSKSAFNTNNSIMVINLCMTFCNQAPNAKSYPILFEQLAAKVVINKARYILLKRITLNQEDLLLLLTTFTKVLRCKELKVIPELNFCQIVPKISNIVELEFEWTNIEVSGAWVEKLMEHKNGNNFKFLVLTITEINIESLFAFIKAKCTEDVVIDLKIIYDSKITERMRKTWEEDIVKYFISRPNYKNLPFIKIRLPKNASPHFSSHIECSKWLTIKSSNLIKQ